MNVLYVYCHPLPESFHAALRTEALAGLAAAGHAVDLLDLYAEGFDPVLTADGRRHYHDTAVNRRGLETYVERLRRAEILILQFPTWTFGPPAMLKGFFDRVLMPGVAFDLADPARVRPLLTNVKRVVGIVTYGRPRRMIWWMANPPNRESPLAPLSSTLNGSPVSGSMRSAKLRLCNECIGSAAHPIIARAHPSRRRAQTMSRSPHAATSSIGGSSECFLGLRLIALMTGFDWTRRVAAAVRSPSERISRCPP